MPTNNVKHIKIWKSAHERLTRLSKDYKSKGVSSASITSLASQAILAIPEPNGNGHQPPCPACLEGPAVETCPECGKVTVVKQ